MPKPRKVLVFATLTLSAGIRLASALPTTNENLIQKEMGGSSASFHYPLSRLSALPDIADGARCFVPNEMCKSGLCEKVRFGLIDLDRAFAKFSRQSSFRGGGGTGDPHFAGDISRPSLSTDTAWAASTLPPLCQQGTRQIIESRKSKLNDVSLAVASPTSSLRPHGLARVLATIWAGWNILNGGLLIFAPKKDSFVNHLVEAIGAVRMGLGINIYLATIAAVPAGKAMGFSLLARLFFDIKSLVNGTHDRTGARKGPLLVNAGIMGVSTICLLSGMDNAMLAANAFSTMTLIKAWCLFFLPVFAARKIFGIDIRAEDLIKAKGKCRSLGFHLLISSVFMYALSLGVEPINAAGMSSLTWLALLIELTFVSGKYTSLDSIPKEYLFFLSCAFVCTIVFLSQREDQLRHDVSGGRAEMGWDDTGNSAVVWQHEDVPLRWDNSIES